MAWVKVLLLSGMLVSCGGGGGDSPSGGGTPTSNEAGTPQATTGGTPPTTTGGTPPATTGGTPPATTGQTPGTTTGGSAGSGDGAPAAASVLTEETGAAVTLSAGWTRANRTFGWSGGAAVESTVPGASVLFTFTGTSVRWIGARSRDGGIARVSVDGAFVREVNLFARPLEIRTNVLTIYDLSPGQHTLTIEVTGEKDPLANSNRVIVDAFEVEPQIVSHWQETHPGLSFTAGWVRADSIPAFTGLRWSGCCVFTPGDPAIGGARTAASAGQKATLKFRGTAIHLIGYRGPDAGIARVQVDGGAVTEVDLYSPERKVQEVVFTTTGLAVGKDHTLTIEATGRKNEASTDAQVVVDAFDVITPGKRYEEYHSNISYHGKWERHHTARVWSEGVSAVSNQPTATATFRFNGTSVSWISSQKSSIGQSWVSIDNGPAKLVDNHKSLPIEAYQHEVFRADGLAPGEHTLTIEVISTDSNGPYTVVDAFDVRP